MEHPDLLQNEGVKPTQDHPDEKHSQEEEDVECVETKIRIWDGEEYEDF